MSSKKGYCNRHGCNKKATMKVIVGGKARWVCDKHFLSLLK